MESDNEEIPDFSGDDFAHDKDVQQYRARIRAYEKMIDDSLSVIRQEFQVQEAAPMDLENFYLFKSLGATITHSLATDGQNRELYVCLAEYYSSFPTPRHANSGTDKYLFGHIQLRNIFPKTYIHKESLKEKIEDVFLKRDVDFSHSKRFSGKFQVLTENRNSLERLLQFKNLDDLAAFPEMELEISQQALLFRSSRKPVSVSEAAIFCELARVISAIFN